MEFYSLNCWIISSLSVKTSNIFRHWSLKNKLNRLYLRFNLWTTSAQTLNLQILCLRLRGDLCWHEDEFVKRWRKDNRHTQVCESLPGIKNHVVLVVHDGDVGRSETESSECVCLQLRHTHSVSCLFPSPAGWRSKVKHRSLKSQNEVRIKLDKWWKVCGRLKSEVIKFCFYFFDLFSALCRPSLFFKALLDFSVTSVFYFM